jgi:serine/threonine-protein kinase
VAIHPGDILAGYRVTHLLGRGGMGEVWAAVRGDAGEERGRPDVAIKVLLARAALKPDLVLRFEREARIASAIKSPYVCELIEVATDPDGAHLLVFEHLSGESLADRLKREQYLPFSEVGPIIDDVLQGLRAAHDAGVIHRDLKPGNIFLVNQPQPEGRSERAKILDFGISKLRREPGRREPTLTDFNATLGSFAYMAPEQVRGAARADERADIYAVGAVAFRSLSGRLPFEGSTAAGLVALKLEKSAPSLAEATGEQWPAGIERFLERALARNREDRFATAAEALEGWRSIHRASRPLVSAEIPKPPVPRAAPPGPSRPSKGSSGLIPAPTKPVITVYTPGAPSALTPTPRPPVSMRDPQRVPQAPPVSMRDPQRVPQAPPVSMRDPQRVPQAPPVSTGDVQRGPAVAVGGPQKLPQGPRAPESPKAPELPKPAAPPVAAPAPATQRARLPTYQVVEDNPTEVDGPPEMTVEGVFPLPGEGPPDAKKRRTGRT